MAERVRFQDPGEGIHEAEIVEIHVSPGEEVKEGQVLMTVETDKADFEVSSPFSGVVQRIDVEVGDTIEVGDPLMDVGSEAGAGSAAESEAESEETRQEEKAKDKDTEKDKDTNKKQQREKQQRDKEQPKKEQRKKKQREKEQPEKEQPEKEAQQKEKQEARESTAPDEREGGDRQPAREPQPERAATAETGGPADSDGRARARQDAAAPTPASPATRRVARELGVDLADVLPSGESGRVLTQDVRAYAAGAPRRAERAGRRREAPARSRERAPALPDFSRFGEIERVPVRSVRRTIARRMRQAWETIPHVTHQDVADVTDLVAFSRRQAERLEAEEREAAAGGLSLTVLAMKAAAIALREHPRLNASFDPDAEELIYKHYCHIGVATDTERGLLVPTIRDVDRKSLAELGRELPEVTERARGGELGRGDMEGGSFTITNVGSIGGTAFTPIINPPQVAILGLGRAEPQPRVTGDPAHPRILPRTMLPLCLAFDHRVCDGADAARFVGRVAELLGDPERLLLHL